jgi:hypothetical protein
MPRDSFMARATSASWRSKILVSLLLEYICPARPRTILKEAELMSFGRPLILHQENLEEPLGAS